MGHADTTNQEELEGRGSEELIDVGWRGSKSKTIQLGASLQSCNRMANDCGSFSALFYLHHSIDMLLHAFAHDAGALFPSQLFAPTDWLFY
jgi:hypothetical protein